MSEYDEVYQVREGRYKYSLVLKFKVREDLIQRTRRSNSKVDTRDFQLN